jgi:single-stranded DNA-binding protein
MITLTGNGRLTRDVQLRTTHSGKTVATISIASDRRDRDADPAYLDLIVWQAQATAAAEHLVKAQAVSFTGRFAPRDTSPTPARTASRSSCTVSTSSTGQSPATNSPRPSPATRPTRTTSRSDARRRAGRQASGPPRQPTPPPPTTATAFSPVR